MKSLILLFYLCPPKIYVSRIWVTWKSLALPAIGLAYVPPRFATIFFSSLRRRTKSLINRQLYLIPCSLLLRTHVKSATKDVLSRSEKTKITFIFGRDSLPNPAGLAYDATFDSPVGWRWRSPFPIFGISASAPSFVPQTLAMPIMKTTT